MDSLSSLRIFFHDYSACCERVLDVCGYLPVISKTSGALRLKLGLIQLILAVSFSLFQLIGQLYQRFHTSQTNLRPIELITADLVESSLKNSIRALVEMLFLAHLSLIVYDYIKTQELQWALPRARLSPDQLDCPLLYQIFPLHLNKVTPRIQPTEGTV